MPPFHWPRKARQRASTPILAGPIIGIEWLTADCLDHRSPATQFNPKKGHRNVKRTSQ